MLLYALAVHPDRRRRGIARALTDWRLALARERHGEEVVVLASIQTGNAGSVANARAWARQVFGATVQIPHRVRGRPPVLGSLDVRAPEGEEWAQAAAGLNAFYAGANLHVPAAAAGLQAWAAASPFPTPFRHYRVAVDRGEVVAGVEVVEQSRLFRIRVERVPPLLRVLAIGVLPAGDVLEQALALHLWHAPGRAAAGRTLWEAVRTRSVRAPTRSSRASTRAGRSEAWSRRGRGCPRRRRRSPSAPPSGSTSGARSSRPSSRRGSGARGAAASGRPAARRGPGPRGRRAAARAVRASS